MVCLSSYFIFFTFYLLYQTNQTNLVCSKIHELTNFVWKKQEEKGLFSLLEHEKTIIYFNFPVIPVSLLT